MPHGWRHVVVAPLLLPLPPPRRQRAATLKALQRRQQR